MLISLPPRAPPSRFGAYVLVRVLGVGGFGVVYEARDADTGERHAIKIAHPDVLTDSAFRARWERETELLRGVRIPGIVAIHGSGEVQGFWYLVMDLLRGEALQTRIDRANPVFSLDGVLAMAERLGRALAALHALGVIHRDVKPGNVMLEAGGRRATLVDLGLARHVNGQRVTASDVFMGTAGYLSPERIRGGNGDVAADEYALAATLFFALTGRPPVVDKTVLSVIQRVAQGETVPSIRTLRDDLPPRLSELIDAMLLPRRESRARLSELVELCSQLQGVG